MQYLDFPLWGHCTLFLASSMLHITFVHPLFNLLLASIGALGDRLTAQIVLIFFGPPKSRDIPSMVALISDYSP